MLTHSTATAAHSEGLSVRLSEVEDIVKPTDLQLWSCGAGLGHEHTDPGLGEETQRPSVVSVVIHGCHFLGVWG